MRTLRKCNAQLAGCLRALSGRYDPLRRPSACPGGLRRWQHRSRCGAGASGVHAPAALRDLAPTGTPWPNVGLALHFPVVKSEGLSLGVLRPVLGGFYEGTICSCRIIRRRVAATIVADAEGVSRATGYPHQGHAKAHHRSVCDGARSNAVTGRRMACRAEASRYASPLHATEASNASLIPGAAARCRG